MLELAFLLFLDVLNCFLVLLIKGEMTVCALFAQFLEDLNTIFKPWGAICLVSAQ